jgi:hypothetical protein
MLMLVLDTKTHCHENNANTVKVARPVCHSTAHLIELPLFNVCVSENIKNVSGRSQEPISDLHADDNLSFCLFVDGMKWKAFQN